MNDQTAKEIGEANELIEQLKSHNGTIIFILIFSLSFSLIIIRLFKCSLLAVQSLDKCLIIKESNELVSNNNKVVSFTCIPMSHVQSKRGKEVCIT